MVSKGQVAVGASQKTRDKLRFLHVVTGKLYGKLFDEAVDFYFAKHSGKIRESIDKMFNTAAGIPEPIQGYPKPQPSVNPPKRRGRPPKPPSKPPQHSQSLSPITEPVDSSAVDDFINDYKLG